MGVVKKEIIKEEFKSAGVSSLDSKNRVTLGHKVMQETSLRGLEIDAFETMVGENGDILLRPMANIPSRELWVYRNTKVLKSIQRGIRDIKENQVTKVKDLGKFFKEL